MTALLGTSGAGKLGSKLQKTQFANSEKQLTPKADYDAVRMAGTPMRDRDRAEGLRRGAAIDGEAGGRGDDAAVILHSPDLGHGWCQQ